MHMQVPVLPNAGRVGDMQCERFLTQPCLVLGLRGALDPLHRQYIAFDT